MSISEGKNRNSEEKKLSEDLNMSFNEENNFN